MVLSFYFFLDNRSDYVITKQDTAEITGYK
jgi:hypothetical protein